MPETADGRQKSRSVALIGAIVFAAAATLLYFYQENSIVATCLAIVGPEDPTWCLTEAAEAALDLPEGEGAQKFYDNAQNLLKSGPPRHSVQYTLFGVIIGACIAFMLVYLMPADQIQLTGTLERYGGSVRFGGAAGLVIIFALAGGFLSRETLPAAEKEVVSQRAFRALVNSHTDLTQRYNAIETAIREQDENFVYELLKWGHFQPMVASISVDCGDSVSTLDPQAGRSPLVAEISGFIEPDKGVPPYNLEIPLSLLSNEQLSYVGVRVFEERPGGERRDVFQMNYRLTRDETQTATALPGVRPSRTFRVGMKIFQANLKEFCQEGPFAAGSNGAYPRWEGADHLTRSGG